MSEQVSLSAAFSVLAMAAFVLFGAPHAHEAPEWAPGSMTGAEAFAPAPFAPTPFAMLPQLAD